jgi:zona occludens toxin (predicted ATPase)
MRAFVAETPNLSWIPRKITSQIEKAYHVEVTNSIGTPKIDLVSVLPAPDNWKQITRLSTQIKQIVDPVTCSGSQRTIEEGHSDVRHSQ